MNPIVFKISSFKREQFFKLKTILPNESNFTKPDNRNLKKIVNIILLKKRIGKFKALSAFQSFPS